MIKKLLTLITLCSVTLLVYGQGGDPILFDVAGESVHVSEFEYIYEKNNRDKADYSEKTVMEYLALYKKFKLKVRKAKAMKLDTIVVLQNELAGYRKQLAKSYLVDNEVSEKLVKEVFTRRQKDRRIAHIFLSLGKRDAESKIENRLKEAEAIYKELKGGKDFNTLCKERSEDKSTAKSGGLLGYFSIPMPDGFYDLETAMCNLKPGEISKPIRTKLGIHILKLLEERPARGEMEVAHIMIKKKLKNQTLINAKAIIDSVYKQLNNQGSFSELAKKHSQDKKTANKGGYLGFFGVGKYDPIFEDAAFKLKNDGDYSKVIQTKTGFHIIQRISKQDDSEYSMAKKRIKASIIKDSRFEGAKKSLIERIKTDGNYKLDKNVFTSFITSLNKSFYTYGWKPEVVKDDTLFSFGDRKSYTIKDFSNYCQKKGAVRAKYTKRTALKKVAYDLLDGFVDDAAITFEEKNLEAKYPDFKSLMREYEEGILLFEATKINVWDKASKDTTGLKEFYALNKQKYVWDQRAIIQEFLISTEDKKVVKKIVKYAKKTKRSKEKIIKKFNKKQPIVEVEEGLYNRNSSELKDLEWRVGSISAEKIDVKNKRSSFKRIIGFEAGKMKTLNEARGYVIADYQDFLESIWVQKLRLEYPIIINNEVLKSLIK